MGLLPSEREERTLPSSLPCEDTVRRQPSVTGKRTLNRHWICWHQMDLCCYKPRQPQWTKSSGPDPGTAEVTAEKAKEASQLLCSGSSRLSALM